MKKGRPHKIHRQKGRKNIKKENNNQRIKQKGNRNKINFGERPETASISRSWQKAEPKQQVDKDESKKVYQKQRKENDNLMKIIVLNETQSSTPDIARIKESLSKIKSRGLKQRLRKKVLAAGITLEQQPVQTS